VPLLTLYSNLFHSHKHCIGVGLDNQTLLTCCETERSVGVKWVTFNDHRPNGLYRTPGPGPIVRCVIKCNVTLNNHWISGLYRTPTLVQ